MNPSKKGRGPLRVDYRPVAEVKPHPKNARSHSPAQIDAIAKSIKAIGWTKPIIVDEKIEILAGHGAYQAAPQLGMAEVPTIMRAGLTSAQKKAYRIADNKIAEGSTWDKSLLAAEFAELTKMGYDLGMTGFDPSEIEFMLAPPMVNPPEPPTPALERKTVTRLGDVWLMGQHRLICADSTKPATYKALMDGRQAQCVFTDPPYGVSYEARSGKFEMIQGDDLRRGQLAKMVHGALAAAMSHTRENAGWYIWHASCTAEDFRIAMRDAGLVENGCIIWVKPGMILGWSDYRWAHEPCFYAARQGVKAAFHGDRTDTTVWRVGAVKAANGSATAGIGTGITIVTQDGREIYITPKAPKGKKVRHIHLREGAPALLQDAQDAQTVWEVGRDNGHGKDASVHPNQKPVELARKAIRNSTLEGEIVLDMFGGSCGTIMAAEQTKRIGYAIELDPHYVDASVKRWQDLTGKEATHGKEKTSFEATAKARTKA